MLAAGAGFVFASVSMAETAGISIGTIFVILYKNVPGHTTSADMVVFVIFALFC